MRDVGLFIGAIKDDARPTMLADHFDDSHFFSIENKFFVAHHTHP